MSSPSQIQWEADEADRYTHPLDIQLFADLPMIRLLGKISQKRILDIGCGNGYLLRKLHDNQPVGIDTSRTMLAEAQKLANGNFPLLCRASASALPLMDMSFDAAICSLTINNLPSTDVVKQVFRDTFRILKPASNFIISVPNPDTLDKISKFRWTEWDEGQSQNNLVPGESIRRVFLGQDNTTISVFNYFWPKEVLVNLALRAGFELQEVIEITAESAELEQYGLEGIFGEVSFFLVMCFHKSAA